MAKGKTASSKKNAKAEVNVIILLVEGETEVEFYKAVVKMLYKSSSPQKKETYAIADVVNMKGIGNFKKGASRQFENAVEIFKRKHKNDAEAKKYIFHAFMCIDTDVFNFNANPPINKTDTAKSIENTGGIPHYIEAVQSIEDWFLDDINGIAKFLDLKSCHKPKGSNGAAKLDSLFNEGKKRYRKGEKCAGLIENLDIGMIYQKQKSAFADLEELIL